MTALIVFSTLPSESQGQEIARKLIDERLAACVNIVPGLTSIYRWQANIETAAEVLLMIKTDEACYPQLEAALRAWHPYELPEILAVAVNAGLPDYMNWIIHETTSHNENH